MTGVALKLLYIDIRGSKSKEMGFYRLCTANHYDA